MGVRSVPPPTVDSSLKAKRDRVIALLTKANDRDTHKRASEELHVLVANKLWMDSDALLMLVHQLCIPTPVQKVFARKECAHILGLLASRQCPSQGVAVSGPTLQKIITQLRKYMQDPDSPVRDAASEAAARVAQGIWEQGGALGHGEAQGIGGGSTNPVGRMLLDCLAEGKKELQAAACGALRQAAPYLGKVDTVMVKEVIKRLNSPSFQAHPALLGALGQVDPMTGSVAGLIQSGGSVLHNHLPQLIGHPGASSSSASSSTTSSPTGGMQSPSTGLCACLSSKDWITRKGASDCLRALFLVLGPLCEPEGAWDTSDVRSLTARCARVLDSARFDKVREVREAAREATALLEVLRTYSTGGGGGPGGWDAHARRAMAVKGSANPSDVPSAAAAPGAINPAGLARPRSSAQHHSRLSGLRMPDPSVSKSASRLSSPPSSPDSKPSARRPSFPRTALSTRFLGAHGDEDVIVESKPPPKHRLSTGGDSVQSVTEPLPQVSRSVSDGVPLTMQPHSSHIPAVEHSYVGEFPAENSYALDEPHKQEEEEPAGMDLTLFNANLGLSPGDTRQSQLGTPNGHEQQQEPLWGASSQQLDAQGEAQHQGAPADEAPPMYGSSLEHLQLDAPPQEPHPQEQQQQQQQQQQLQGHTVGPFPVQASIHTPPPHSHSALAAASSSAPHLQPEFAATSVGAPSRPNSYDSLGTGGSNMLATPGPLPDESISIGEQQQQQQLASPRSSSDLEPSAAVPGHAAFPSHDYIHSTARSEDFGPVKGAAVNEAPDRRAGEGWREQDSNSARALPSAATAGEAHTAYANIVFGPPSSLDGLEHQGEMISVPAAEWHTLRQRLQEVEGRNRELEEALAALRAGGNHTVTELQSHIAHLEGQRGRQGEEWMQPSSPKRQAPVSLQGSTCSTDVNAMYAQALQHNTGPPHLLELMKHTGICWSDLQPQVAHQLLAAFATCAQFPDVLPKAMPWLWRLADEQQTPSHLQPQALPADTRQSVLEGLGEAAANLECSHPSLSTKAALLMQTLRSHWSAPESSTPAAAPGFRNSSPKPSPNAPPALSPHHHPSSPLKASLSPPPFSPYSPTSPSASRPQQASALLHSPYPQGTKPLHPPGTHANHHHSWQPPDPPSPPRSSARLTQQHAHLQPPLQYMRHHHHHHSIPHRPASPLARIRRPQTPLSSVSSLTTPHSSHPRPPSATASLQSLPTPTTLPSTPGPAAPPSSNTHTSSQQPPQLHRISSSGAPLLPSRPLSAPFPGKSNPINPHVHSSQTHSMPSLHDHASRSFTGALGSGRVADLRGRSSSSILDASPLHQQQLRPWLPGGGLAAAAPGAHSMQKATLRSAQPAAAGVMDPSIPDHANTLATSQDAGLASQESRLLGMSDVSEHEQAMGLQGEVEDGRAGMEASKAQQQQQQQQGRRQRQRWQIAQPKQTQQQQQHQGSAWVQAAPAQVQNPEPVQQELDNQLSVQQQALLQEGQPLTPRQQLQLLQDQQQQRHHQQEQRGPPIDLPQQQQQQHEERQQQQEEQQQQPQQQGHQQHQEEQLQEVQQQQVEQQQQEVQQQQEQQQQQQLPEEKHESHLLPQEHSHPQQEHSHQQEQGQNKGIQDHHQDQGNIDQQHRHQVLAAEHRGKQAAAIGGLRDELEHMASAWEAQKSRAAAAGNGGMNGGNAHAEAQQSKVTAAGDGGESEAIAPEDAGDAKADAGSTGSTPEQGSSAAGEVPDKGSPLAQGLDSAAGAAAAPVEGGPPPQAMGSAAAAHPDGSSEPVRGGVSAAGAAAHSVGTLSDAAQSASTLPAAPPDSAQHAAVADRVNAKAERLAAAAAQNNGTPPDGAQAAAVADRAHAEAARPAARGAAPDAASNSATPEAGNPVHDAAGIGSALPQAGADAAGMHPSSAPPNAVGSDVGPDAPENADPAATGSGSAPSEAVGPGIGPAAPVNAGALVAGSGIAASEAGADAAGIHPSSAPSTAMGSDVGPAAPENAGPAATGSGSTPSEAMVSDGGLAAPDAATVANNRGTPPDGATVQGAGPQ